MQIQSAIDLIGTLVYKPGWTFTAEDHSNRFEGTITLRIDYPAQNSNRDKAAEGYPESITTYAIFPIVVSECSTMDDLAYEILKCLIMIETHEAREFLRFEPTLHAPFHPRRVGGMRAWSERTGEALTADLQFGIA